MWGQLLRSPKRPGLRRSSPHETAALRKHRVKPLSMSRSKEHDLTAILDSLSPDEVAKSDASFSSTRRFPANPAQVVLRSFQSFFRRGTKEQCQILLPQVYKLTDSTTHEPRAKATRVSNALKQIHTSEDIPAQKFDELWNLSTLVLGSRTTDAYKRVFCLVQDVNKLEELQNLRGCMIRMGLLFLSHSLERIEATLPESTILRPGQRRKSVALDIVQKECKLSRQKLKELCKRSHKYLCIAEKGGIGSLLAIGDNLSV